MEIEYILCIADNAEGVFYCLKINFASVYRYENAENSREIAVSVIIPKRFLHNYLRHVCAISPRTSWCTLYVLWTHNSPFSTKLRTRILLFTVQPHVEFMVTATTKYPSVLKHRWRKRLRLLSESVI